MRPLLAELFGTFVLVFVAAGACALKSGGVVGAALAYGAAFCAVATMIGGVSGAHVNPAVTLGLAAAGRIGWVQAARYCGAQLVGALLAALALKLALADRTVALGATLLSEDVTPLQGLLLEAVLTSFVAFAATVSPGKASGPGVGLALAAGVLVAFGLTGASMNPARTLGPGIVAERLTGAWIYVLGPIAGAVAGARLARFLRAG